MIWEKYHNSEQKTSILKLQNPYMESTAVSGDVIYGTWASFLGNASVVEWLRVSDVAVLGTHAPFLSLTLKNVKI